MCLSSRKTGTLRIEKPPPSLHDRNQLKHSRQHKGTIWALVALGVASLSLVGCFDKSVIVDSEPTRQEAILKSQGCSNDWYEQVDSQVTIGEGEDQGGDSHGPDLGSDEWRSVVEFKLGIRGDEALSELPEITSEDWCRHIDEHYIQDHDWFRRAWSHS